MNEIVFSDKGLSIERLRLLCDVARSGGIRAAVGDDPIRQSLASRQLKELGEYVHANLTQRIGRGLEMTEHGKKLAEISDEFFSKLENFLLDVRNAPSDFKLGVGDSIFQWQILPRMRDFDTTFPSTKLISFSFSAHDIIKSVEARRLDAGIVRRTAIGESDLSIERLGEIKYKLFIPNSLCRPTQRNQLPIIADMPFCTLTGNGEYARAMARFLSAFGGISALNCSSMTQVFAAVQSGQYAAVLPAEATNGLTPTTTKSFTLPELTSFTREVALIYRPDARESHDKSAILDFLSHSISKERT